MMALPENTLLELMAYADGELEPEAKARVEQLLSTNGEARSILSGFSGVGEWVRLSNTEYAAKVGVDGIADVVMGRLAESSNPISLADYRRRKVFRFLAAGGLATASIAAGFALVLRTQLQNLAENPAIRPTIVAPLSSGSNSASEEAVAQAEPQGDDSDAEGVEVQQLESPSHEVSVFYLPAVAAARLNASTVVIWIADDNEDSAGGQ